MYQELFDPDYQNRMTAYFADVLAPKGTIKQFKKNTLIDPFDADHIYIVLSGECRQGLISENGNERTFFRLNRGTIFGEMDYFEGARTCEITHVMEKTELSIIPRAVLEESLRESPEVYRYFIHSIIRKYRLLMMQLADARFNDSIGIMASILLRIGAMQEGHDLVERTVIKRPYTHEELANNLGLSRPTVTSSLNYLKDKGLISLCDKNIVLEKVDEIKALINSYW
ncbi:Crp/Fnr family transcriptional regulator [Fusibacter ferrireducens]|uniref:Crp/Fnr family transcriptional regulator n=1 Tax=Fusibacter ferrireducens TaxID=2785058 RepID=A0ABR9ZXZ0_9FIRM|nr:Crp/Fnr family transcriptional regulator [Fusibacter ferrireducens]MBF4695324.1 Crp/Fnr family transcriptional regulator [Fusibacter ferrireducens]